MRKGLTFIELLLSVAIILVLVGVVIGAISKSQQANVEESSQNSK